MKVPPKPPEYSKDRTLTRRTVAGAAGGMLGVHYEDTRHNDVNTIRAHTEQGTAGAGANRAVAASGEAPVSAPPLAPDADESALGMVHGKEEA
ncbi:MAG: hypothetical protein KC933_39800, partial [Myxococcales bacterium]|nr:hypothetical protein [Myxococcales bacterium]